MGKVRKNDERELTNNSLYGNIIIEKRKGVDKMFTIKNEEVLAKSHKGLDDLTSGQLFTFMGGSELYLMTDDMFYVSIPNGFVHPVNDENADYAVTLIKAEITIL